MEVSLEQMAALTGTRPQPPPKGPQSEVMTLAKPLALVEGSAVKKSPHSGAIAQACGQTPRSTATCFKKSTDLSQNVISVPPITCSPHPPKISGEVPSLEISKTHSLPVDKGATPSSTGKKSTDAQRKKKMACGVGYDEGSKHEDAEGFEGCDEQTCQEACCC